MIPTDQTILKHKKIINKMRKHLMNCSHCQSNDEFITGLAYLIQNQEEMERAG
jgi:hypothetical protein